MQHYNLNPRQRELLAFAMGIHAAGLTKAAGGPGITPESISLSNRFLDTMGTERPEWDDREANLLIGAIQTAATMPGTPPGVAGEFEHLTGILRAGITGTAHGASG